LFSDLNGTVEKPLSRHLQYSQKESERNALLLGQSRPALEDRRARIRGHIKRSVEHHLQESVSTLVVKTDNILGSKQSRETANEAIADRVRF
jgi:hypothetical protein